MTFLDKGKSGQGIRFQVVDIEQNAVGRPILPSDSEIVRNGSILAYAVMKIFKMTKSTLPS